MADSPYKFLDAYGMPDRELFFGRKAETQILLSDIVISRLVVLFARTGTGKTSLINAGVRPELEDRGYATFVARVGDDPARSALEQLAADKRIGRLSGNGFSGNLRSAARRLGQPVVLFFDQFEEFFIYVMRRPHDGRSVAARFISDVAEIHADAGSGVHFVFSMREDFMAEMDHFRAEIPSIFHQDSNLRLRWFEDVQAKEAIRGPASAFGVPIDEALVDRLVEDLRGEDGIEPAQIQIVCDTLWRRAADGRVTESDYAALGEGGGAGTIAERILRQRLEEQFEKIESREQLDLLAALLPTLRTPQGTKYIRDLPSLVRELDVEEAMLRTTLKQLEQRSRVVRRTVRDQLEYVELTHDYLAAHVDELAGWVRTIWPRRVIRWAIQGNWHTSRDALEDVVELVLADPGILATAEESASLLQFALGSGMHVAVARELLELARTRGADTVHVVAHALEGEPESARGAVELIVADAGPELLTLLRAALARDDDVAGHAVEVLSGIETSYSVELLARALGIGALVQGAELALASLAASRRDADVARDAAKTLISHLAHDETDAGDLAPALGRIQHPFAVAPLAGLLGEAEGPARGALFRLARSPSPEVADAARAALLSHLADALPEVPPHVIDELGELEDEATVAFLARAVAHPPLAAPARQALARLYRSRKLDVASAAEDVLARTPAVQAPRVPTRPLAPAPAPAPAPVTPSDEPLGSSMPSSSHFEILGRRLLEGRVVLFTGAGVNLTGVPSATGSYLPSGRELAAELASSFAYPSYEADDLLRVSQYVSVVAGSAALYDKLRTLLDVDAPLTAVHGVLASLPARMRHRAPETAPVFMTTNFDDMLERALDQAREPYHVIRYQSEGLDRGRWLHVDPSGTSRIVERPNEYGTLDSASTVIVKLAGSVDRSNPDGDSYVITEDDYVGYLAATDVSAMLPASVGERLMRSHFLFLGYSLRDWNLRVVLQRLLGKERRHYKSWAVMTHADRVDQQLWRERDVEIIDAPLEEYAHELSRHLDATAEATW